MVQLLLEKLAMKWQESKNQGGDLHGCALRPS